MIALSDYTADRRDASKSSDGRRRIVHWGERLMHRYRLKLNRGKAQWRRSGGQVFKTQALTRFNLTRRSHLELGGLGILLEVVENRLPAHSLQLNRVFALGIKHR